ncbi:hypothetical protein JCM9152_4384 [Halalkalibacter hemicellulosilyticusJCM 9152]|uniref:Uncharacterized protein n=1 Tax=Halalkalibacter hemicellulosilyticusJCM 9152 TaxID=1236971 RepID=W4QN91_9BACI|nr:hypothetical protein JCM9152_4384 [Halalkalibacter hemicellulosilyticusJCM 9152]
MLGKEKSECKDEIRKALKQHDLQTFMLWLDTYENTFEEEMRIEKYIYVGPIFNKIGIVSLIA